MYPDLSADVGDVEGKCKMKEQDISPTVHPSILPSVHALIPPFIHHSIHLFIHPSVQPSILPSVRDVRWKEGCGGGRRDVEVEGGMWRW